MTNFKRIIKMGFINFARHGLISWSAVLVITITLFIVTAIILLQAVFVSSLIKVKDKVDIAIYFNVDAPENKILLLKGLLEKLPEVNKISYTSAENALKLFRERHNNDYSTVQALEEIKNNPLGAYLSIKAKEISQYQSIVNFMTSDNPLVLGSTSIISKINYNQNKVVIDRLNNIIFNSQRLGFIIILLLIIISIITTLNTIRLTIFIAKEEISVMRLVGASKSYIHGPFMVEGGIYGLVATIINLILFWPISIWFGNNMSSFLGINVYDYYLQNFFQIFVIILFSGILLGMISSFLAVRKYLPA
jgi:cell division transport system permease protein